MRVLEIVFNPNDGPCVYRMCTNSEQLINDDDDDDGDAP